MFRFVYLQNLQFFLGKSQNVNKNGKNWRIFLAIISVIYGHHLSYLFIIIEWTPTTVDLELESRKGQKKSRKGDLKPQGPPLYIYVVFGRFSSLYRFSVSISSLCLWCFRPPESGDWIWQVQCRGQRHTSRWSFIYFSITESMAIIISHNQFRSILGSRRQGSNELIN